MAVVVWLVIFIAGLGFFIIRDGWPFPNHVGDFLITVVILALFAFSCVGIVCFFLC